MLWGASPAPLRAAPCARGRARGGSGGELRGSGGKGGGWAGSGLADVPVEQVLGIVLLADGLQALPDAGGERARRAVGRAEGEYHRDRARRPGNGCRQ